MSEHIPYNWDDEDMCFQDEEESEEEEFDCGAMRDMNNRLVGCSMAGTEDCDFECPYLESVERSLRAQAGWQKRKAGMSEQTTEGWIDPEQQDEASELHDVEVEREQIREINERNAMLQSLKEYLNEVRAAYERAKKASSQ